ncbi:hypothetical protein SOM08_14085 [Hydrogenophaga sp. SNF1]|uniref:hypothetical protein n=1 Tax=Hydrogenophaga sp. SNF1 TaxID=3098762 RepID=UPI002ACC0002|nr:hypothetical protein [Hydrogenophaga sp. SNF1]WQB82130.1 hypothetical protein SOM08_14085 [Hydrogenophaga sp. SNF1]
MKRTLVFVMVAALPLMAPSATIYLCKAYGGGTFWASNHCNQHNALIERIVSVPDGMPFNQQVDIGNQQLRGSSSTSSNRTTIINNGGAQGHNKSAECEALDQTIKALDSAGRAPQSLQSLDRIRAQRKNARDRQFALKC